MSKSVGIRELKTHLSRYLKDVKEGEEILVSERGSAIARLLPMQQRSIQNIEMSFLQQLSSESRIIMPSAYRTPPLPAKRKKVKGSLFSDAVREGRR